MDNASTDGSADLVADSFPGVRLIRNAVNCGFGHGNNLGASSAGGQFLVFLNPDTEVESGWLEPLIAALRRDPNTGLATSKILLMSDPTTINTCGCDIHISGITLCRSAGTPAVSATQSGEVGAVSGAAFGMRRELFDRLGGFDGTYFLYMEDTDLSLRARLAGFRTVYVPDSVVHHDYQLRIGPNKTFYQERNRYLMLLKTWRWRTLLLLLPALATAELVTWGFVILRDRARFANKVRAYVWVARNWSQIMAARRETQAMRAVTDRSLLEICTDRLDLGQVGTGPVERLADLLLHPLFRALRKQTMRLAQW